MYKIPANTLFMGHSLVFMPECHSTNSEAFNLIQTGKAMEGTVVITANQTAGRGQRNNTWEAAAGKNFTFSIVLKPGFLQIKDQFYLNLTISLGIADYLQQAMHEDVKIKWPNDIIVRDKKVSGILIENQLSSQQLQYSIVGIGLNVNQDRFAFDKASSMKALTGWSFELENELPLLLNKIEMRYLMLREGKYQQLVKDYLSHLYWRLEKHTFSAFGKNFEGTITGIDDIGRLIITDANREMHIFNLKEVEFLY